MILAAAPMLVATLRARDAWLARRQYRQATIGFASERLVARKLDELRSEGWTTRHSLGWRGHGDIDHVVIAPSGVAFAIETKTKTVVSIELVAREQEVAVIGGFLSTPPPAVGLLEGPAGVGKTSLWNWALEDAGRRGMRVLQARPVESESQLS